MYGCTQIRFNFIYLFAAVSILTGINVTTQKGSLILKTGEENWNKTLHV
jgi:hypothetical protein